MEITKKKIQEIIDSNSNLIGYNAIPTTGSDLETQAKNTTDYNKNIEVQPFRFDMLGRYGFSLLPFMEEGKENEGQKEMLQELINLMHEIHNDALKYYYKNPNKLKSDYRKNVKDNDIEISKDDAIYARRIIKIVEKHFEKAFEEPKQIDESKKVCEDEVIEKKEDNEIPKKSKDNTIRSKKLEKIADLISKLDKKDVDTLMKLLENKK